MSRLRAYVTIHAFEGLVRTQIFTWKTRKLLILRSILAIKASAVSCNSPAWVDLKQGNYILLGFTDLKCILSCTFKVRLTCLNGVHLQI